MELENDRKPTARGVLTAPANSEMPFMIRHALGMRSITGRYIQTLIVRLEPYFATRPQPPPPPQSMQVHDDSGIERYITYFLTMRDMQANFEPK